MPGRLSPILYVQVHENRFELCRLGAEPLDASVPVARPFTTRRLLVGTFSLAEATLRDAVRKRLGRLLFRPVMVMHPMAMVEDGLSEVEERVFRELGRSAGARRVVLHLGDPLSDREIRQLLLERNG